MTQEETKTPESDELNKLTKYYIKNPWVILLGISKYEEEDIANVDGAVNAVQNMYQLFKDMYGYKHVYQFVDKLEYTRTSNDNSLSTVRKTNNIVRRDLRFCLQDQKSKIEKINLNNNTNKKDKIDSLVFYYCGQMSGERNIICSDSGEYNRSNIFALFDNENCEALRSLPKIYISDDCPKKTSQEKKDKQIKTKSTNDNNNTDETENKLIPGTTQSDQFFWYASPKTGDEDDENKIEKVFGGFFTTEIYNSMSHILKNQKKDFMLQGKLSTLVNKRVSKASNKKQAPESINKLQHAVYFAPSDTSSYKPENLWKDCLTSWGLSKYIKQFKDDAWDDMIAFKTMNKEDCEELKMEKKDIEKFISSRDTFFFS